MIEAERAALRRRYAQERDKRLRPDGNDQYLELKGRFSRLLDDPYTPRSERDPKPTSHWVLAAWGSRETGAGVAAGGHGPALLATGVLPVRRPAP